MKIARLKDGSTVQVMGESSLKKDSTIVKDLFSDKQMTINNDQIDSVIEIILTIWQMIKMLFKKKTV
jgi:hypothetical protein